MLAAAVVLAGCRPGRRCGDRNGLRPVRRDDPPRGPYRHPAAARPERLWLAAGGDDLRADFCTPTVLLCSQAHADAWARSHDQQGELLDLEAGATMGGEHWATCAAARMVPDGDTQPAQALNPES